MPHSCLLSKRIDDKTTRQALELFGISKISLDDLIAEFKRLDAEKSPDPKPPEPKAAEAEPKPQA